MRKALIVFLSIASFAALASLQPASAASNCRMMCDQQEMHNGKLRCFSEHLVCTKSPSTPPIHSIQEGKLKNKF